MFTIQRSLAAYAAVVSLLGFASVATAADLGMAEDYNVFTINKLDQDGGTTQGSIAAGGNATIKSASIGGSPTGSAQPAVVVGGNLTIKNGGSISHGGICVGGNTNLPSYYYTNYSVQSNCSSLPVDFSMASRYLVSESSYLGALSSTGAVTNSYNKLTLTGTSTGVNVFYVSSTQLSGAWGLYVDVPKGATAVVNVEGKQVTFKNGVNSADGGFSLDASRVLYNFYEASEVNLGGLTLNGSVLAPNATVNFKGGNLNGTMVAYNFNESSLAIGKSRFQGTLPSPVPEPSGAMAFCLGAMGLVGAIWRRTQSTNA